jgi:hypothetical protein
MAQNEPKFGSRAYSWAVSKDLGRIRGLRKAISEILLGNRFLGIGRGKLLYVDAVLDHNVLDQLVRKTIVFCEQKRPEMVGVEAEQFQELLVHEFRRQCAKLPLKWPVSSRMVKANSTMSGIKRPKTRKKSAILAKSPVGR